MQRILGNVLIALVLFTLAASPPAAHAYPISPNPLWSLIDAADLVVVARVAKIEDLETDEDSWTTAAATLDIVETWKGKTFEQVVVHFTPHLICPAPPRYLKDETLVAFLRWDSQNANWRTVSLSYGTLYPSEEERRDMQRMVERALEIRSSWLSPRQLKEAKLEWFVQAAALPGTRWHGLYELDSSGDRVHSFYDLIRRDRIPPRRRQLKLLSEAFQAHPKGDHTSVMMLRVLRNHSDPRLDQLSVGFLEALFALDKKPYWLPELLVEVLLRHGDPEPRSRLEAITEFAWDLTEEELLQIWTQAKTQLAIPDRAPVTLEMPRSIPVGGQTPD